MFCDNPTVMDGGAIAFSRSVMTDLPVWRELAREVEQLLGAPMAENEAWNARLKGHIDRATAWCARTGMGVPLVGGMWVSFTHPMPSPSHGWPFGVARRRLDRGPVPHRVPPCSMPPTGTEAGPRVSRPYPHPDDDMLEATRSATPGGSYPAPHPESRRGE